VHLGIVGPGEINMLIQVRYPDNRFDYVKDSMLHGLIESRTITGFRRSSGWVTVGIDPLRQFQRNFNQINHKSAAEVKNIVRVEYNDNRYDYVTEKKLDSLLESSQIVKFKRITGWVTIGVDPLRKPGRPHTFRYPNELKKRER
jgi:hypothetical protein